MEGVGLPSARIVWNVVDVGDEGNGEGDDLKTAAKIVGYVLLGAAIASPFVICAVLYFILSFRRMMAKWKCLLSQQDGKEKILEGNVGSEAYPHFTGNFRFAVARGDLNAVVDMLQIWKKKGRDSLLLLNSSAHGDKSGFTSIHIAAINGSTPIVEFLLVNGVSVNLPHFHDEKDRSDKGDNAMVCESGKNLPRANTPLHYASYNNNVSCVALLLKFNANIDVVNGFNKKAIDIATSKGFSEIVKILLAAQNSRRMSDYQTYNNGAFNNGDNGDENVGKCIDERLECCTITESITTTVHSNEKSNKNSKNSMMAPLFLHFVNAIFETGTHEGIDNNDAKDKHVKDKLSTFSFNRSDSLPSIQSFDLQSSDDDYDRRGYDGLGTQGTSLLPGTLWFRIVGTLCELVGTAFIIWRPLFSIPYSSPSAIVFSAIFYISEVILFLPSYLFVFVELWRPICRSSMDLRNLTTECGNENLCDETYPTVDVIITCYNEPVEIVEGTLCAALSLVYPRNKLQIFLLDDKNRHEIRAMVSRVIKQAMDLNLLKAAEGVRYIAREKKIGIPHNAKAGNINNAILCEEMRGQFIVVYDSDMVAKPDFLVKTLGHFLVRHDICNVDVREMDSDCENKDIEGDKNAKGTQSHFYLLKSKTAFLQVPQDFYNVTWLDPLGHASRFFYGPMMQGRDGLSATPCVGTGVIFRRDALLSIGGQSYGSVTEDYLTCMTLQHAGFSTMYLNDRLVYGLSPDDLAGTMRQRMRWAVGSLQIMFGDPPLLKPGLTMAQRIVFFQSQIQYVVSLPLIIMLITPVLYMYCGVTPILLDGNNGIAFLVLFVTYYWLNRSMMYIAGRSVDALELWRGSQQYVYMVPNNLFALWKVFWTNFKDWICVWSNTEITFDVTEKKVPNTSGSMDASKESCTKVESSGHNSVVIEQLQAAWPFLLYYGFAIGGLIYNIILFSLNRLTLTEGGAVLVAFAWTVLTMLYMWPVVGALLPTLKDEDRIQEGNIEWVASRRKNCQKDHNDQQHSKKSSRLEAVGQIFSAYGEERTNVLRRATLATVVHPQFDIVKRLDRPSCTLDVGSQSQNRKYSVNRTKSAAMISPAFCKISPLKSSDSKLTNEISISIDDQGVQTRDTSLSSLSFMSKSTVESKTSNNDDASKGLFGQIIASTRRRNDDSTNTETGDDNSTCSSDTCSEEGKVESSNVITPTFHLSTKPRHAVSMYLFFIVNGLLFLFFIGGGITYIILERNKM